MLKLKNIEKNYYIGENVVRALRGVSIEFRKSEFVAILGPSGCGKTTLLNIIGGLDKYSKGDLLIDNKSTKYYSEYDWDTYRNHSIGFVFQSYNLIPHQSVLNNVELALTLSGISKSERRKKAIKALESVGLHDQIHKKPNQLSGGQMQRVAIARALVNDPEIILADEPTGALDSETSKQIMEILKEISKNRLIIMVTHNPDIANTYATRIVKLLDGVIISDSNPYETEEKVVSETKKEKKQRKQYEKHTSMSFLTALSLSLQNLFTKKGRTILTAFAGSIGIIGIALVLALSHGFQSYVDKMQSDTLSAYPLTISAEATDFTSLMGAQFNNKNKKFPEEEKIYVNKITELFESMQIKNDLTDEYINNVIKKIDPKLYNSIKYKYGINVNVFKEVELSGITRYQKVAFTSFSEIPVANDSSDPYSFFKSQYDVIGSSSRLPNSKNEVVLVVNQYNQISDTALMQIGIYDFGDENGAIDFNKIIGQKFKIVLNDVLYTFDGEKFISNLIPNANVIPEAIYNDENNIELTIVGIVRPNKQTEIGSVDTGAAIAYSSELTSYLLENALNSEIIKWMNKEENATKNPLTGLDYVPPYGKTIEEVRNEDLVKFGGSKKPVEIVIYAKDFESKNLIKTHLDKYNETKKAEAIKAYYESIGVTEETATIEQRKEAEKIGRRAGVYYVDLMAVLVTSLNTLVNAISIVLIIFTSISLVVSSIMIGIITYISVLERTKEIGILRSIGARRKDISRVFNAETLIIGFTAGLMGIIITILISIPANVILANLLEINNLVLVNPLHALILILISMVLTLIAGLIPSSIAAKKDPVIALRTE